MDFQENVIGLPKAGHGQQLHKDPKELQTAGAGT
jgi:hypothetical protein